jgi:tetratricopeptide (TPR) repeat protein
VSEAELTAGGDGFGFMCLHLRWALAMLRGRFEEIDAMRPELVEETVPHAALLEGVTAIHRGDTGAALRYLAEADGRDAPHSRQIESLWLRFLAQTAAASGDPRLCERARDALLPHRDLWGLGLWGCEVSGPMNLWLGLVDAAEHRWDEAEERLIAAYRSADRLLARPWSVEARLRLAETLAARGDANAARALLTKVAEEASGLDMRHALARSRQALAALGSAATPPIAGNVFRRDGKVWTLTYGGRTVHMPDAKGLRDLHRLLGSPGTAIPAVDLLAPEGGETVTAARRMGGDAVLDDEAKARYEQRLRLLDEEIDRAVTRGDDGRAAEYDRERAALLEELRAAAGLAGRTRRLGDEAERTRKTVTARIRDTLRKLDETHPGLAAHLRAAISTGTTCTYTPDPPASWRL